MKFIRMVLKVCGGKPVFVVDKEPWYPYVLKRMGLEYVYEAFGSRNKVERFYNNINTENLS